MKRYLTAILIASSGVIIFIGTSLNLYWSGIVAWGLAIVLLLLAAYYTKYIPNEKKGKE
ncbi:hypothetical protein [Oceanobacillus saliphilus]|uniref:hypothetical protein n=1 Tax=Oceanobacillus saliphilus TaxID=2925834 RepID=UPI00201E63F8|nr:hypothetical protein [Oceanobacillus saliphilus]